MIPIIENFIPSLPFSAIPSSPAPTKYQIPDKTKPITPVIAKIANNQKSKFEAIPKRLPDGKPYGFESVQLPPPIPPPQTFPAPLPFEPIPTLILPVPLSYPTPHSCANANAGEKESPTTANVKVQIICLK